VGTTQTALASLCVAAVWLAHGQARADCIAHKGDQPFPTCFDVGNQIFLSASSDGFGAGGRLRHVMRFDDEPDLVWKLDHRFANFRIGGLRSGIGGALYSGRYLRHARDGHIILPFGIPKKLFLPFDIGAEAQVGRIRGKLGDDSFELGVVRAAALIDLARTPSLKRRLSIGAIARWDMDIARSEPAIDDHQVVPFSAATVNTYLESSSGLTILELSAEAGRAWTQSAGWRTDLRARASLERTLVALNDRPLSLFVAGHYDRLGDELVAELGLRIAIVQRRDRRTLGSR
jgi:hypothetical protein